MFVIGMILFGSMLLVAIFAPLIAPHTYDEQNMAMKLTAPCAEYPLGTDQYGRCIFSRVVYGSRIALSVGIVAVIIETVIGVTLGMLAGYYGKKIDKAITFVTDSAWAIPPIILAMAIVLMLGSSAMNVAIAGGRSKLGAVYQDSKGQGSVPQGLVLHRGGQNIRRKRFQHFDEVYFAEPHIYHNNIGYAGPACGYLIHHFDGLLGTGRAAASA